MTIKHGAAGGLLVAAAAALLFGVVAQGEQAIERSKQKPPPADFTQAAGQIERIDGDHQIIKTTTIFVSGRTGTLDDLNEGQVVRATYEEDDRSKEGPVAQWIEPAK